MREPEAPALDPNSPFDLKPGEDFSDQAAFRRALDAERQRDEQAWRDSQPEQIGIDTGTYRRDLTDLYRPQVAISQTMGQKARAIAAIASQRPQTLDQFPGLRQALAQADVSEDDARNLMNLAELDAAFVAFTSTDDPITQRNILLTMNPVQRAGFGDYVGTKLAEIARAAEDPSIARDVFAAVGTALKYALWLPMEANELAYRYVTAATYGQYLDPSELEWYERQFGPNTWFVTGFTRWDEVGPGKWDEKQLDVLRAEYGDYEVQVLVDLADEIQRGFNEDDGTTPFNRFYEKYANDVQAQAIIRAVISTRNEDSRLLDLSRRIEMASLANPGQIFISQWFGNDVGVAGQYAAGGINLTTRVVADPTLIFGKAVRVAQVLKYSAYKLAPVGAKVTDEAAAVVREGAESAAASMGDAVASGAAELGGATRAGAAIGGGADNALEVADDAVVDVPVRNVGGVVPDAADPSWLQVERVFKYRKVQRFYDELGRSLTTLAATRKAERAGKVAKGTAANQRDAIRRVFGPQWDDDLIEEMAKWNGGKGVRNAADAASFVWQNNGVERVIAGQTVGRSGPGETIFERVLMSARNAERRTPLVPTMSLAKQARGRARIYLAQARNPGNASGRRTVDALYEDTSSSTVAATLADDYLKAGKLEGITERGRFDLDRLLVMPRAGGASDFRYADMSLSARVDRVLRLFARKPGDDVIAVDSARDTDKVYKFARAFFSSYHAKLVADAFRTAGSSGERRLILNGLVNSALEAKGISIDAVRAAEAGSPLARIGVTGSRRGEKYAPTVRKPMAFDPVVDDASEKAPRPQPLPSSQPGSDPIMPPGDVPAIPNPRSAFDDLEASRLSNPSQWGDREHALHLWQTADYIRLPDYAVIEEVQQRAGAWMALFGWTNSSKMQTITDLWSLGTLYGPRYVARNSIEDGMFWWMTSGRWADVYRGRRGDTIGRASRGPIVRRPLGGKKDESKEYSRLGYFNARKRRKSDPDVGSRAVSNFVFANLDDTQQSALRQAWQDGDAAKVDEYIALAMIQARASGISPRDAEIFTHLARTGPGQHVYDEAIEAATFLGSGSDMLSFERRMAQAASSESSALGSLKDGVYFKGEFMDLPGQGDVSPGFFLQWYRAISGVVNADGPIGKIALANLRLMANNQESRRRIAERIANVIRKDTQWRYKERMTAFFEQGATPEDFAERYITDVMNMFSKSDGTFNDALWNLVVREQKGVQQAKRAAPVASPAARDVPQEWLDTDYYAVLGVERDASDAAIRAAYRRKSREVHPDVNPSPDAAEQFRQVRAAYDVLSDSTKRARYDEATAQVTPTGAGEFVPYLINMDELTAAKLQQFKGKDRPEFISGKQSTSVPIVTDMRQMDRVWEVLGMQYARVSRAPMFLANAAREYRALDDYEQWLAGVVGKDAAKLRVKQLASDRAYNVTMSYVDNPANRTLFAWNMRNVARYYRATEDFFRRMMRLGRNYPDGIWKVALTYDALDDTGFVYRDENGDKYFIYPGTQFMTGAVNSVMSSFGVTPMQLNPYAIGGKVLMMTPSTDPNQLTSFAISGPFAFPMRAMFDMFPNLAGVERAVLGDYTASSTGPALESLVPAGVMRLWRLLPLDDRSGLYAQSLKGAAQIAVAAGYTPENLGQDSIERWRDGVSKLAITMMTLKTIMGYTVPASPQVYQNDVTDLARKAGVPSMRSAFLDMIAKEGDSPTAFTDALIKWVETFGPEASVYTVSKTEVADGITEMGPAVAADAVTDKALTWVMGNKDVIEKFPVASTYLFPRDGEFDYAMWKWWRDRGYRQDRTTEDFFQALFAAEPNYIRTSGDKVIDQRVADAKAAGDEEKVKRLEAGRTEARKILRAYYPWYDINKADSSFDSYTNAMNRLLNGDVYEQGELRRMVDWYYRPDAPPAPVSVEKIAEAIATYDYYTIGAGTGIYSPELAGNTVAARTQRKKLKEGLVALLQEIGSENPNAGVVVEQVLLPLLESGVKAYEWGEQ